ncbi:hypothetical protein [Saccharopolyspora thermophila]|nr:hypothetical protein [Saccharopolyspora subtropica]
MSIRTVLPAHPAVAALTESVPAAVWSALRAEGLTAPDAPVPHA